jgi:isopentenyl-diphosphate delta-isomerase type 1
VTATRGQSPDELFDVVDAEDRVIARRRRVEVHAEGLFHRAVHLFVFHPDGRMLLQKRSRWNDAEPGKWTSSCAGHLDAGEDYNAAVMREAGEELGLELPNLPEKIAYLRAVPELGQEFVTVYRLVATGPFVFPEDEVEALEWWEREDLRQAVEATPDHFAGSFRYLMREVPTLWGE